MKTKFYKIRRLLYMSGVVVLASGNCEGVQFELVSQNPVLAMNPSGYWPVDEGSGNVLYDRSGNENHGQLFHVPWKNGMLEFTSAYQWAEMPGIVQGSSFSFGGWLFTRRADYVSGGGQADGMVFFGNSALGIPWPPGALGSGISVGAVGGGLAVAVRSDGTRDVLGSMSEGIGLESGTWQHLIYTFDTGTGRLYVNGQLVKEKSGVPFNPAATNRAFFVGADASWWMVHPPPARSLDGSVKSLVMFERALTAAEVSTLCAATYPQAVPSIYPDGSVRLDAKTIPLQDLSLCSVEERRKVLEVLTGWSASALVAKEAVLLPVLEQALDEWEARGVAARLLAKLNTTEALEMIHAAVPGFIQTVGDDSASREERFSAALALAGTGAHGGSAVETLIAELDEILLSEGLRVPRVEDLLRNALIRALLDIDRNAEGVAEILARALPNGDGGNYFSQGDEYRDGRAATMTARAYTPAAVREGMHYQIGAAIPFNSADPVSAEAFQQAVAELSADYPDAEGWRASETNLYRVKIIKTGPDGQSEEAFLEGGWFIFDGTDAKMRGWSVAIDQDGYIHLTGGQHNAPNPDNFIPGSWEKMNVTRDRAAADFPAQMYWVSESPGDITSFKFAGQKSNPRAIPVDCFNYMNFVQDQNGELYVYGRASRSGWQSWGLYRYDLQARSWSTSGGDAFDLMSSADQNDPDWRSYLIRNIRGSVPAEPGVPVLAWAWQPHFYNYCRASWGIQFDRTNRMHVRVPIRGLDAEARIIDRDLYAWSDDGGATYFRADGSPVELPLTLNPAPGHNADRTASSQIGWDLWLSLLKDAGYQN
jgi:hypothetical protein